MKILIYLIVMCAFRGCLCEDSPSNSSDISVRASSTNETDAKPEQPIRNLVQCFKAESVFQCFNQRVGVLVKFWREALLNSVRRSDDQPVNENFEDVIRDIGKAVYYGFTGFFYNNQSSEDADSARSGVLTDDTNVSDPSKEERGHHHKKKKVHKEVKKLVIKVIVAIFLVMQKIKWALLMIQTILLNNFIVVATLFVLSKTIKVWHEIKHKHHHVEKQVVVYDNVHHQHYDNGGDHSEYEEGHGHNHGWGWWGRSLQTPTEPTVSEQDYDNEYYNSRVIRSLNNNDKLSSRKRKRTIS